jgi:murein L,D-transpeptidase YcbB/YkuD
MENMKFYLVTFLLVVGAGLLGYGAISSLRDPVYYVNNKTLTTVGDMKNQNPGDDAIDQQVPPETPIDPVLTEPVATSATTPTEPVKTEEPKTTSGNADLIARLKKIPKGTVLKNGSSGDSVKAVQEALNIVANTKLPTTGTFGGQTETAVKAFQKSAGISPQSGQVADKTLAELIKKLQ